jgi:UDPglucose 6-dehydrogenase
MNRVKIVIAGDGIVGGNMKKIFPEADIHDPPKGKTATDNYDIAFICVPTPCKESGGCETSIVEQAIFEVDAEVYCIRSTIPPCTSRRIQETTGKRIVFMPEYYGETVHANNYKYDFIILGGSVKNTSYVADLYKRINTAELRIFQTTFETAELVKYMENCFLGLKVTFCNEFYRIAKKSGVNYEEMREMFISDPRVGRSHTFVYEDTPYYDSKCLNKDIPSLIEFASSVGVDASLMKAVRATNDKHKSC